MRLSKSDKQEIVEAVIRNRFGKQIEDLYVDLAQFAVYVIYA